MAYCASLVMKPPRLKKDRETLIAEGNATVLPIRLVASRLRIGPHFFIASFLFTPLTIGTLLLAALQWVGPAPIQMVPFIISAACGVLLLPLTAKLLYFSGSRLIWPDMLTLSKTGLSIDSFRDHRQWAWSDITDLRVKHMGSYTTILLLSLKEGVPGYMPFRLFGSREPDGIRLSEFWKTPCYFGASEYLRDLIEPIWAAHKEAGAVLGISTEKQREPARVA